MLRGLPYVNEYGIRRKKREVHAYMMSGAVSSWDYSSRLFVERSTKNELLDVLTYYFIPVDLNSLHFRNAENL